MQDRVDDPPIVRCPGCDQPMEAKERTPVMEHLVDILYVCAGCGIWRQSAPLQTKRIELVRVTSASQLNREAQFEHRKQLL